ncbi:hypothetical protein AS026_37655 [Rhizobium altiplani]|uniref:Uncharacterized protein n=1 Tax=Rhizobium altiplani TaxID=1864509 RepID=A0A109JUQ9_9HYPH|nr:hypothetical protein AS026_37655 [Rhizobium altiplani]
MALSNVKLWRLLNKLRLSPTAAVGRNAKDQGSLLQSPGKFVIVIPRNRTQRSAICKTSRRAA